MPVYTWDVGQALYVNCLTGEPYEPFLVDVTEPTALNTGPRVAPTTNVSGDVTLTTAQVYSGKIVTGRIIIPQSATGLIVIQDNRVDCSSISLTSQKNVIEIHQNTGATVVIRFNELIGQVGMIGVGNRRHTTYRNNIHHVEDFFRLHNSGGTGTALDAEIYANYCHDMIMVTPDPYNDRTATDNRTHSDGVQIEGGTGANIHGNAIWAMASTDATSNVEWAMNASPYQSVVTGTANARVHPQGLSCLIVTPSVSTVTGLKFNRNWCYGGDISINIASSSNASTAGEIVGNRFDRNQWHATNTVNVYNGATFTITGNVYMDDASAVQVRRP